MRETIIVAGSLAQRPGHGGHTWVFLQYLLGFRRARLGRALPRPPGAGDVRRRGRGARPTSEDSVNLRYLAEVMERLRARRQLVAARTTAGREVAGAAARARSPSWRARRPLLLNVMGFLDDEESSAPRPLRVFLDIDPGFGQMWQALGLAEPFRGHDRYVTDRRAHRPSPTASIPTCGHRLDHDQAAASCSTSGRRSPPASPAARFTSVASWRGPFGPIEYEGRTYGLRVHEFRRFLELPGAHRRRLRGRARHRRRRRGATCDRLDASTAGRSPTRATAAGDPWRYRDYVQRLGGRADGRQEPLRRDPQRLVQRPQRLLPGQRHARCSPRTPASTGCCRRARGCSRSRRSTRRPPAPRRSSRDYGRHSRGRARDRRGALRHRDRVLAAAARRAGSRDERRSSSPGRSRTSPAAAARRGCA